MMQRSTRGNFTLTLATILVVAIACFGPVTQAQERQRITINDYIEGSLDLEGLDVTLDPTDGAPRIRPQGAASYPDDKYWRALGMGMDGVVNSLIGYNGDLIAGGSFATADGVAANHIASWDGSNWSPLGSGTSGGASPWVYALAVYDGKLIVGGQFTTAGGVAANFIASWDGSSWSSLGTGIGGDENAHVRALIVYDGNLIAGGRFTSAGGVAVSNIARWDGSTWHPLGSETDSRVTSLTIYNGDLIAGGEFTIPGGAEANGIGRWDGSTWQPLGLGIYGFVYSLVVHNTELIIGGCFMGAGGMPAGNIARWNGSIWQTFGESEFNCCVMALTAYDGDLIAAGCFSTAEWPSPEVYTYGIARWDGSAWYRLGSGAEGEVVAVTVHENELIAGGHFAAVGDGSANNIAAWSKPSRCCIDRVGDANGLGGDDPTIGDVSALIDAKFIAGTCDGILQCLTEADINQSGGLDVTCNDITIGDISELIDYLFIAGPAAVTLPDCL